MPPKSRNSRKYAQSSIFPSSLVSSLVAPGSSTPSSVPSEPTSIAGSPISPSILTGQSVVVPGYPASPALALKASLLIADDEETQTLSEPSYTYSSVDAEMEMDMDMGMGSAVPNLEVPDAVQAPQMASKPSKSHSKEKRRAEREALKEEKRRAPEVTEPADLISLGDQPAALESYSHGEPEATAPIVQSDERMYQPHAESISTPVRRVDPPKEFVRSPHERKLHATSVRTAQPSTEQDVRRPSNSEATRITSPGYGEPQPAGHTRSPILAREPTMLEAFSRTVRNYVPSSIPIPNAAPSPPRVSRPVSFGSFMTSNGQLDSAGTARGYGAPRQNSRRGIPDWEDPELERTTRPSARSRPISVDEGVFQQDDADFYRAASRPISGVSATFRPDTGDDILWSKWDIIWDGSGERRVLILGYASGFQIWDCTHLGSVSEILNLSGKSWQGVIYSAVLPRGDHSDGPSLGVILPNTFLVYSLHRHHVTKDLSFPGVLSFSSTQSNIVLSTVDPPTLHILSTSTLQTLHVIPSSSLVPLVHPHHNSINNNNNNNHNDNVLPTDAPHSHHPHDAPRPVYALSGRLLAYASMAPPAASPTHAAAYQPRTASSTQAPRTRSPAIAPGSPGKVGQASPSGGLGMTNAEIGNAALKVGGSVLSGMRTLGGMAFSAAKSAATGDPAAKATSPTPPKAGGLSNLFFSRSAPAAVERRTTYDADRRHVSVLPEIVHRPGSQTSAAAGYYVTVVDLNPLTLPTPGSPLVMTEFFASKSNQVSDLHFTGDGTSLVVSPKDGQVLQIYKIRSMSAVLRSTRMDTARKSQSHSSTTGQEPPFHLYDLRRGRTSAVVEGIDVAGDGRWVAIGTRKRTVHVFPVNPYGGKADSNSHLEGTVRNVLQLPLSTDVSPIVRLRVQKTPTLDQVKVPLSFTFIDSSESCLPTNLLPAPSTPYSGSAGLPSSYSDSLHSEPLSPHPSIHSSGTNYQDVLLFDPLDGTLSLRRFVVEVRSKESGRSIPGSSSYGMISSSLPGMSASMGRMGSSPRSSASHGIETPTELVAKDMIVANWNLRRREDWSQIKRSIDFSEQRLEQRPSKADWLSHAELSTCSRSHGLLPRSIYLSHQFSFHALGEDYHALIRRFQLDLVGKKINVRKEVQASPSLGDGDNSFLEGFSSAPRDMRRTSSSFDEPLASALSAGLDYDHTRPAVLPMLPNGGNRPGSFRNSIPIRAVAAGLHDGVSGVSGRIRRELGKARSPPTSSRSISGAPVPLEFDEEDEDFTKMEYQDDHSSASPSRDEPLTRSVSTPATSVPPAGADVLEDDPWGGWGAEDKEAVEEAERFDDISAAGIMDEEQRAPAYAVPLPKRKARGRKK